MRAIRPLVLGMCALTVSSRGAPAQMTAVPTTAATLSTRSGVYTAAQAERGRVTYAGMCRSCHTPASHTGVMFEKWWKGRTLADLFGFMSAQMPKNNPGSLNPDEYADVVAYLLKMNAMPVGKTDMPTDSVSLAAVRIEMQQKPLKSAATDARKPKPSPVKKGD